MSDSERNIKKLLLWWWGGLAFFLLFFHSNNNIKTEEGMVLDGAWNMLNGREIYVDFFEFVAPGSFYLISTVWEITGAYLWIANAIGIVAIFFSAVGIYKMSTKLTSNKSTLFVPLFFVFSSLHWPIISYNTFNLFFVVWGTYFFLKGLQKGTVSNFISSGLYVGFSTLFFQHRGSLVTIVFFVFLLFVWLIRRRRYWKKSLIMFSVFSLLPLLVFFKWPLGLLYSIIGKFALLNYLQTDETLFALIIFFLAFLLFIVLSLKKISKEIILLVLLQVVLLSASFYYFEQYHVLIVLFPLLIIAPYAIEQILAKNLFTKMTMFIFVMLSLWLLLFDSMQYEMSQVMLGSKNNQELLLYVKQNCPQNNDLFVGPFMPGVYYETEKLNPTSFSWLVTDFHTEGHFNKVKRELEISQPRCAVMNYAAVEKFNYSQNNSVDEYVVNNYKFYKSIGDFEIFIIK